MCAELIGTAFADRLYKKEYEMIQENILELVKYGLSTGLVDPEDKVYTINRLRYLKRWKIFRHGHRKRQKENLRESLQK